MLFFFLGGGDVVAVVVDVRTRMDGFNWRSSLAAVQLRDITASRYITYENVRASPQSPGNRED